MKRKPIIALGILALSTFAGSFSATYAAYVRYAPIEQTVGANGARYIYLSCSQWSSNSSSNVFIYTFQKTGTNEWIRPKDTVETGLYAFDIPSYDGVIFVQTSNGKGEWGNYGSNVTYQTSDLSLSSSGDIPAGKIKYTISTAGGGSGNKSAGAWGNY